MELPTIIPPADLLKQFEGIESGLRQRRRLGSIGWIGVLLSAAVQIVVAVNNSELEKLLTFDWKKLSGGWPYLAALFASAFFIVLYSWSKFWLKESEEPLPYICSITDFQPVVDSEKIESFRWLSHDLTEKLSQRVERLRFTTEKGGNGVSHSAATQVEGAKTETGSRQESHVHISGVYGLRKDLRGRCVVEVMPRVRIGSADRPETISHSVKYTLSVRAAEDKCASDAELSPKDYQRILERVYFSVSTEIYKQIQKDVEGKIVLLPRTYFRAVALYWEAEDYAKSNTLDAYNEAGKLYEQAAQLFDPRLRPTPRSRWRRAILRFRCRLHGLWQLPRRIGSQLWHRLGKIELVCARAEIGYANTRLYRRVLAAWAGQPMNPVYDVLAIATRAVERLQNLPADMPGRKQSLFDGYVSLALSLGPFLGSHRRAKQYLARAHELDPDRAQEERYLCVRGLIEPHLRSSLQMLQRAVELNPRFELSQFSFANNAELLWRTSPTFERNVAETVLNEYDEVARINPGNLGAWANKGYVLWLLGDREDLRRAREEFEGGREYKIIKRETFVGELDHGLARIAAETGDFKKAYGHYVSAMAGALGLGSAETSFRYKRYYFDQMSAALLGRFARYLENVKRHYEFWDTTDEPYVCFLEALQVLNHRPDIFDHDQKTAAIETVCRLITCISSIITDADKEGIRDWIESKADEVQFKRRWIGDGDLAAFARQVHGAFHAGQAEENPSYRFEVGLKLLTDSVVRCYVEKYLEAAATQRVRESVYAFALGDYADACRRYHEEFGGQEMRRHVVNTYKVAIAKNSNYVMPYLSLRELTTDRKEHDEYLRRINAFEPDWPETKLALAESLAGLRDEEGDGRTVGDMLNLLTNNQPGRILRLLLEADAKREEAVGAPDEDREALNASAQRLEARREAVQCLPSH